MHGSVPVEAQYRKPDFLESKKLYRVMTVVLSAGLLTVCMRITFYKLIVLVLKQALCRLRYFSGSNDIVYVRSVSNAAAYYLTMFKSGLLVTNISVYTIGADRQ